MNKEQQSRETVKYEIPRMRVVELDSVGIICQSGITPRNSDPDDIEYGGRF